EPTTQSVVIGLAATLLGESIRFWGVAYAGSLTRATGSVGAPAVIMAGPYAFVRNPLYVGNILMYVGIGILSNALFPWLSLVAAVVFIVQYTLIVSLEEEFLEKEFGAGYGEYKKNVPRFIPRLVPYRTSAQAEQQPNWKEALRSETRTLQALVLIIGTLIVLWRWN
ncbi:MAG TPA: methyltransferase, partial [Bacteroidota bacterium]|nr:methyltransferase [Bacteroidota bacterium]